MNRTLVERVTREREKLIGPFPSLSLLFFSPHREPVHRLVGYRNDKFFFTYKSSYFECHATIPMIIFRAWATCASPYKSLLSLGKAFLRISRIRNIPLTWILARVFVYVPPFTSQILDFIYWTVLIFFFIYFEWRDTENQQFGSFHVIAEWYLYNSSFQSFVAITLKLKTTKSSS